MKIIKRLALENYCYEELHFESLEEYEEMYPKYVATFKRVKEEIRKANQPKDPFPDDTVKLTKEEEDNLPN